MGQRAGKVKASNQLEDKGYAGELCACDDRLVHDAKRGDASERHAGKGKDKAEGHAEASIRGYEVEVGGGVEEDEEKRHEEGEEGDGDEEMSG